MGFRILGILGGNTTHILYITYSHTPYVHYIPQSRGQEQHPVIKNIKISAEKCISVFIPSGRYEVCKYLHDTQLQKVQKHVVRYVWGLGIRDKGLWI